MLILTLHSKLADPLIDGVRINSPHYLCKIPTAKSTSPKRYTLVVSQYEKTTTIHYTLRVYSSCPFKMGEIVNNCKYKERVVGKWDAKTAGGCGNYPETYMNNPTYRIELKQEAKLIIDLKGPKDYQIGFDVICSNANHNPAADNLQSDGRFFKKSTGPYR
jgi:calpain-7